VNPSLEVRDGNSESVAKFLGRLGGKTFQVAVDYLEVGSEELTQFGFDVLEPVLVQFRKLAVAGRREEALACYIDVTRISCIPNLMNELTG
jgi:hypothetical protein